MSGEELDTLSRASRPKLAERHTRNSRRCSAEKTKANKIDSILQSRGWGAAGVVLPEICRRARAFMHLHGMAHGELSTTLDFEGRAICNRNRSWRGSNGGCAMSRFTAEIV